MASPVRVLIVDDSALIRQMFTEILSSDPGIEVLDTARDAMDARAKIKALNPDVITLDVEMPGMDGISFLEKIMTLRPMPVVMASTLTQKGADITLRALEIGAVEYVSKPTNHINRASLSELSDDLIQKVKTAAQANTSNIRTQDTHVETGLQFTGDPKKSLITIGSSTGGVEAIRTLLKGMPANSPPIVITQHMPATFTASFAARMNDANALNVHEAREGMPIEAGNVYIAPGAKHMQVKKKASGFYITLDDGPEVSGHKPSVDVLFESVAKCAHDVAVGAILTGMGSDGAEGLLKLRNAGAPTLGEDKTTCVVYGMPRAADNLGAVEKLLPLHQIAKEILSICNARK